MSWTVGNSIDDDGGLIYKTRNDARSRPQQSDPWAGWNDWCDARIDKMFEESYVPGIGEALALERKLRREEMQPIIDVCNGKSMNCAPN